MKISFPASFIMILKFILFSFNGYMNYYIPFLKYGLSLNKVSINTNNGLITKIMISKHYNPISCGEFKYESIIKLFGSKYIKIGGRIEMIKQFYKLFCACEKVEKLIGFM